MCGVRPFRRPFQQIRSVLFFSHTHVCRVCVCFVIYMDNQIYVIWIHLSDSISYFTIANNIDNDNNNNNSNNIVCVWTIWLQHAMRQSISFIDNQPKNDTENMVNGNEIYVHISVWLFNRSSQYNNNNGWCSTCVLWQIVRRTQQRQIVDAHAHVNRMTPSPVTTRPRQKQTTNSQQHEYTYVLSFEDFEYLR